jgi:hypothetical protein
MPKFIAGLKLNELYYEHWVGPIIKSKFPNLRYSAGLIGSGSEVLGYDTPRSRDHNWGLRFFVFLPEKEFERNREQLDGALKENLPHTFRGYSTSFGKPDEIGVRLPQHSLSGKVRHYIIFYTIRSYFKEYLHIDPYEEISVPIWLTLPQQKLLSIVKGKIFHDDLGIRKIIKNFAYYPRDVWLFMLASQWSKISQEEAFIGRAAEAGDELGSKILASRMVRELIYLYFLMEKKYIPYSKWFGRAFTELKIAGELMPIFAKILDASSIKEREQFLGSAYSIVAKKYNSLSITKKLDTRVSKFFERPYLVIRGDDYAKEIRKQIRTWSIRKLPMIGSIDQIIENEDFLQNQDLNMKFKKIFEN